MVKIIQFHQVVRAMTPVFTVMLNVLFLKKTYSGMIYISLIPVSRNDFFFLFLA